MLLLDPFIFRGDYLAKQFAIDFGAIYYDLDEHFILKIGNISQFIAKYGYKEYAIKNIELYKNLITTINPDLVNIIVCSSGFMTYPNELMESYPEIKTQIEKSSLTFLLLPSFELEICVKEIVKRQLQREYLNCSLCSEERKIRNRFPLYINLKCQRILTNEEPQKIACELYKHIF
ncbi:hypothetical protein GP481_18305 [Acinetobacter sp. 105-3]|nr:hypothetical protein [Acinetobacter sp. 105-3]